MRNSTVSSFVLHHAHHYHRQKAGHIFISSEGRFVSNLLFDRPKTIVPPNSNTCPNANPKSLVSQLTIYYNDVYEVKLPPKHRFPMEKYRQVRDIVQSFIIGTNNNDNNNTAQKNSEALLCQLKESPLAQVDELTTTHCPLYVQRFLSGQQNERELRNVGFPWSEAGVARALSSVGGTVAAAMDVCSAVRHRRTLKQSSSDQQEKNGVSWGAHIAGGTHHAFFDRGEGFCVFSDIAVAANVILEEFPDIIRRVLIIDLDVHQGNGNAKLFTDRDDVVTFSMHCRENYFSPKEISDLDIELPTECNDDTYLQTLQHWLKRIFSESMPFDLIFFQAGVDILADDRLGRMSLSREGIKRRNDIVFDYAYKLSIPLVITMGGGYPRKEWAPILEAHSDVYIGAYEFLLNRA